MCYSEKATSVNDRCQTQPGGIRQLSLARYGMQGVCRLEPINVRSNRITTLSNCSCIEACFALKLPGQILMDSTQ